MSTQIASLTAKIGADVTGLMGGLGSAKSALEKLGISSSMTASQMATAMSLTTAVVGVTAAAIIDSYKAYAGLAEQVRNLALVSGTSADEASRFIQVLDDYQITAEDATTASRFLAKNGLSPNIDTLAKLADRFKAIKDPAERMQFVQENLGRSGAKWVNILSQESSELRRVGAAVRDNLILNDMEIKMYEVGRLAIDDKRDALQGLRVKFGENVGNVLAFIEADSRASEIMKEHTTVIRGQTVSTMKYKDALALAIAEQLKAADATILATDATIDKTKADEDAAIAAQELSDKIGDQISLINNIQDAEDDYTRKSKDLTGQRKEAEEKLAKFRAQGYWEQSDQIQGALRDIEDIKTAEADLERERERQMLEFISGILAQNLARDGWTTEEFNAFADQQVAWGLWSEDARAKAAIVWQEADKITASINAIPANKQISINIDAYRRFFDLEHGVTPPPSSSPFSSNNPHAAGGTFEIPSGYGNEGFRLGNGDTASGGELISITPKGKSGGSNFYITVTADFADPETIARRLKPAVTRVMREAGVV